MTSSAMYSIHGALLPGATESKSSCVSRRMLSSDLSLFEDSSQATDSSSRKAMRARIRAVITSVPTNIFTSSHPVRRAFQRQSAEFGERLSHEFHADVAAHKKGPPQD